MNQTGDRSDEAVPATLEHELRQIREAIALVASGAATRTMVVGLQLGDVLLDEAGRMARESGVRLVPLWRADEAGADIAIERLDP